MDSILSIISGDFEYILYKSQDVFKQLKGKSVFLTGGTGFIGKWLLRSLIFANDELSLSVSITVLTRNIESFKNRHPKIAMNKNVNFIFGDIRTFTFPDKNIDYIIHAATDASATLNVEQPLEMADVIISGTKHVLEFAKEKKIKRILFLSSGAVYGIQPDTLKGFSEDYIGAPNPLISSSSYAEAKRMGELMCATYAQMYGIEIPIVRCFAFVGPYLSLDTHFAIGNFIRNGLNKENILIKGDGLPLRSYMYSADLIVWLWTILLKGRSVEAYNVGSDKAISIKDLAYKIASCFPDTKVEILNLKRPTDRNQNYIPNVDKARFEFGFEQGISLDQAIFKTIEFNKNLEL